MITAIEGELDGELSTLRNMAIDVPVDPPIAARLTTHLMLRTAHVRSIFEQGSLQIFDAIAKLFADPNTLRDHLNVDELSATAPLRTAIDEALQTMPLDDFSIPRALAQRLASFTVREQFEALYEDFAPKISQALTEMTNKVSGLVRDAHNRALETTQENQWEERLSKLSWRTQSATGVVLPDCVALAREIGQGFAPLLLSDHTKVDLVILPLAHDRVLIGSKGIDFPIGLEFLNAASAACSDSFFISRHAEDGAEFSTLIGQRCALAIQDSITDALAGYRRPSPETSTSIAMVKPRISEVEPISSFSFSLTCLDFGDLEMATRLSGIIKTIVQELSRDIPLSTLDGVTFALNYSAALENIDRGDTSLPAEKSQPRDYGRPTAKAVQVYRDGEYKTHLVIEATMARSLLSDDEDNRTLAIHMIVNMLAGLAHRTLYEAPLIGTTLEDADEISKMLYSSISAAPGSYFGARVSAFSDPKSGERYADLVRASLYSAREEIEKARLDYRHNNDLDGLLGVAFSRISFVLNHAAEWLGHRDGLTSQGAFPGSSLPDVLKPFGLHLWLELFGRDLRNLYDLDDYFTGENLFRLTKHAERLLWTVQIFPWPMEDGTPYVSVPLGNDAALLKVESVNDPNSL